jgi:malate permease and related proteins
MASLLLLFICLVLGVLVRRFARPSPMLAQSLNWWALNIALSALVLHLMPQLQFDWHLWFLIVSMWLVFFGAWAYFVAIGRALNWSRGRVGALTLVCGLGNTAFIGFALIEALRGPEALKLAVIADQPGTFVMLAVGGAVVSAVYSGGVTDAAAIARRVFLFPPFVALIAGVVAGFLGGWPNALDEVFARIGGTLIPIALFSVGLQLRLQFDRHLLAPVSIALAWKLVLAPLLIFLLGVAFGVSTEILTIAVLQAAMAPMISAAILADQNGLEPQLANVVLGIGILLAFATVPAVSLMFGPN